MYEYYKKASTILIPNYQLFYDITAAASYPC